MYEDRKPTTATDRASILADFRRRFADEFRGVGHRSHQGRDTGATSPANTAYSYAKTLTRRPRAFTGIGLTARAERRDFFASGVSLPRPGLSARPRRGLRALGRPLPAVRPAARRRGAPLGRRLPTGPQDDRQRPDGPVRRLPLHRNHAPPFHARRRLAAPILRATLGGSNTMRLEFTLAGVSPLIMHNGVSMLSRARIEGRARPPRGVNPYIRAPAPTCTYDGRTSRPIPTSPPVSVRTDRGTTVPARDSDGRARRTRRPANPCTCRARSMTLSLCGGLRRSGQSWTSRS